MALPLNNDAQGIADETDVTAANSGTGTGYDDFDVITKGATGVLKFDTAQFAHGSTSFRFSSGGTAAAVSCDWTTLIGAGIKTVYGRVYLYVTGVPAVSIPFLRLRTTASAQVMRLQVRATEGGLETRNGANAIIQASTTPIAFNQWVRIEFKCISHVSAGEVQCNYYSTAEGTSIAYTVGGTGQATNGGDILEANFGISTAVANVSAFWMQGFQLNGTGYPGRFGAIATPAVVAALAAQSAVTAKGVAIASPAAVAAIAGQPAVTAKGAAITTPAVVAAVASVPAVTAKGLALVTPAVVAATASVPAVTAQGAGVTSPTVVAAIASVPAVTAVGGVGAVDATATPSVVSALASVSAVTAQGAGVGAPATVAAIARVPLKATVWDSFNRADGAVGNTESGHPWVQANGTWVIDTNKLKHTSEGGWLVVDSGLVGVDLEVTITNQAEGLGLLFAYTDGSNYLRVGVTNSTISLGKISASVFTSLDSDTGSYTTNRLRVTFDGATGAIVVYVDGVPTLSYTLDGSEFIQYGSSTLQGVFGQADPDTRRFDDFQIAPYDPAFWLVVHGTAVAAPSVVAAIASIPAVTAQGTSIASPSVVAAIASVPAVTARGAANASPAVVAALASVPAVTAKGLATASPAVVAAIASVPAVTAQGGGVATPAAVTAVAAQPPVTGSGTGVASPSVVSAIASVPPVTTLAGSIATPAVVAALAAIPGVTARGTANVFPATVAAFANVPPPTGEGEGIVYLVTVGAIASVLLPIVTGGAFAKPSTVAAISSVPPVTARGSGVATPQTVLAVALVNQVLTGGGAIASPAVVAAIASIPNVIANGTVGAPFIELLITLADIAAHPINIRERSNPVALLEAVLRYINLRDSSHEPGVTDSDQSRVIMGDG